MNQEKRLLTRKEVRYKTATSDTYRYEEEKAGRFPKKIQISPRRVAWYEHEIDAWIEARRKNADIIRAPIPDVRKRKSNPVRREAVKSGVTSSSPPLAPLCIKSSSKNLEG